MALKKLLLEGEFNRKSERNVLDSFIRIWNKVKIMVSYTKLSRTYKSLSKCRENNSDMKQLFHITMNFAYNIHHKNQYSVLPLIVREFPNKIFPSLVERLKMLKFAKSKGIGTREGRKEISNF